MFVQGLPEASKKKVFILSNSLQSGGAEKQAIILAKVLQENYETVLVIFNDNSKDPKLEALVKKYEISMLCLDKSLLLTFTMFYRFVKKERPAAIFSYLAKTNFLNALVGKMCGVVSVGGIRNAYIPSTKRIFQRILHNYFLTASVSNSFTGKDFVANRNFVSNKMYVIQNAYLGNFYDSPRDEIESVNILSVGRFVEQKNYFTALKVFDELQKDLAKQNMNIGYTIVGHGKLKPEIVAFINQNNIKNVSIIENPDNLEQYLINSNIYLSTSLFEGVSNSIMEAMAFSLPIVASNVGDNRYLVKNNVNGFLVETQDSTNYFDCLKKLCVDPELRDKMGSESIKLIKKDFSLRKFKSNYLDLLEVLHNEQKK